MEIAIRKSVFSIPISNELLKDSNPDPLTPEQKKRWEAKLAKERIRTDCGAVLYDAGEGLHDMGECHLPAGHEGDHEVTIDWPRSEWDERPLGTPVPVAVA